MTNIRKYHTKHWPQNLLEIHRPPNKLWIRGKNPDLSRKWICVVGARKNSEYGKEVCEKLIKELSPYPVGIISGLAFGIDAIAHKSAIENNIPTIAIPGSGLDENVLYPRSNIKLAEEILNHGGSLISEFPHHFKATPWSFPQRNRIMAGFADALLIIEARKKSGTLITARLATDFNRDVMVVPGSIFSELSEGTNDLIRDGATPITKVEDILEVLSISTEQTQENKERILSQLNTLEQLIYLSLQEGSKTLNEICEITKLESKQVSQIITLLELKGFIKDSGGRICQM